eukprot:gene37054-20334_t
MPHPAAPEPGYDNDDSVICPSCGEALGAGGSCLQCDNDYGGEDPDDMGPALDDDFELVEEEEGEGAALPPDAGGPIAL